MDAAVARLLLAHERDEPLVIFGDYDVDGVTSTTILLEVFRTLGWRADAYLPNRMDEGYGLSRDGVENCLKKFPVSLIESILTALSVSFIPVLRLSADVVELLSPFFKKLQLLSTAVSKSKREMLRIEF